mgnify:CR=1 FL=1
MNRKTFFTACGTLLFAALCGCMAETNRPVETVSIDPDIETIDIDTETDGFTYYDLDVQEAIQSQIDALKEQDHTMEDPLLIFDPYGTNTTSLYIWFEEEEASALSYTIQCDGYADFNRTLYSNSEDNTSSTHEHQLIGLVPGESNTITLSAKDSDGTLLEQVEFTVEAPQLSSGYPTQIEKNTENDTELSEGLYMTFGLNYSYDGYSFLIDNEGTVRGELPLDGDMIENIMFYDDTMFYSVDLSKAVRVDRLGKVIAVYEFPEYELHHDYVLNSDGEIIALATEYAKDSVEDIIIAIDLESGDVEKIIDFDEVMGDYKALTQPYSADSMWGSQDWDWLHFNSIQLVNEDEMILSSRETSTIMKFDNIYDDITIDYFIGPENVWADTAYSQYLLTKEGNFTNAAGQHNVVYETDDSLEEGQYYLYFYNNNFWSYESRSESISGSDGNSTSFQDDGNSISYYTRYLVDENEGTYQLVDSLSVPYSSIVSSVQWYGDELIVNSGMRTEFYIYDADGELLASYAYNDADESIFLGYRIYKYSFTDFWFA